MQLGLQVSSLREHLKTPDDVRESFIKIKEIGFNCVQIQYIGDAVSTENVKESLNESGLECVGTQDDLKAFNNANVEKIIARNLLWQAKYVCAAIVAPQDSEENKNLSSYLNDISKNFRENGLVFEIHPLFPSLVAKGNITPFEILMERLDDEILIQPDFFHVFMSKTDPVNFIEKYSGKIFEAHFKDCKIIDGGLDKIPSYDFDVLKYFPLTPIGQGVIDWKKIVEACKKHGVEYCWAEQEEWEKDAFECMNESFDYLMGFGLEA